jgi:glycosyltransferase involved in cell wall biosynthesis
MVEPSPDAPRVSAITVVKNGERHLADALASIRAQTRPAWEILVVDGRSTDGTAAVARSFPGVRYLEQHGQGLADARNQGLAAARGDWVAFLDHDDLWAPEKLEVQLSFMLADPALQYTTTLVQFVVEAETAARPGLRPGQAVPPRRGATPSTLLARRALFTSLGGFDPAYRIGCDADWFTRARDQNVPTAVLPRALTFKRLHEGNLSVNAAVNRAEMFRVARQSLARRRARGG